MLTEPAEDYARGYVPFLDCTIYLDSRPLIPRIETEYWTEKAVEKIRLHASPRCLDLFAGSGAIGVAVLKHAPGTRVDFGEIDAAHLPTIQKNIRENGISPERTRVTQTDVWSGITEKYDFVLANPPYISREKAGRVQDSVLLHEPEKALFADDKGFALIEKTISGLKAHLLPHGMLYLEHEPEQAARLMKLAGLYGFTAHHEQDQYGVLRYSILKQTQDFVA